MKNKQHGKNKIIREHAEEDADIFSLDLAEVKLLYRAIAQYKPTENEEQLYNLLRESLDEVIYEQEGSSPEFPRD